MAAVAALALSAGPAICAGVTSHTAYRTYWVQGTTPRTLVGFMQRNPFPGDHGGAYANIRPSYELSFTTAERGGECHAEAVTLDVRFVVTLPAARDEQRMSGKARAAWHAFAAFARRHEDAHRASYLAYARTFVARARAESASSCPALRSEINQMLREARRSSEVAQAVFDRQHKQQLAGLGLFRLARQ